MDRHSLEVIDYYRILEMLKDKCHTPMCREILSTFSPSSDFELIKDSIKETDEAKDFINNEGGLSFSSYQDMEDIIKKAKVRSILSGEELWKIKENLSLFEEIRREFEEKKLKYPYLYRTASKLKKFTDLRREIEKCIDEEGNVKDDASSELKSIRRRIRSLRQKIIEKLESLFTLSTYKNMISDHVITVRNGRYVIPIKRDFISYFPSIVQDTSGSGKTLFVEPQFIVQKNNELIELKGKEEQEVKKVLTALSNRVSDRIDDIETAVSIVGFLDFTFLKGRVSNEWDCVSPVFVERKKVKIEEGRHPLIDKERVVPISLEIGEKFRILIITGPNTGGKTVTLKTIGLFVALAQSGFHVPAKYFETGIFNEILADIGEEQSIEQSLSTFSSHMKHIVRILEKCDDKSLVLLDELGAGTDPEEGAAIAQAITEYLLKKKSIVAIATHYPRLKEFAYKVEEIENCSVGFDPKTLKPTYKLHIGIPGESHALTIATHLGIEKEVIEKAKEILGEEHLAKEVIINKMKRDQTIIEKNKLSIEETKKEIEEKKEELENLLNEIKEKRKEYLLNAKKEALKIIEDTRRRMEELLKNIPKERKVVLEEKKELEKEEEKIAEEIVSEERKIVIDWDEIEIGDLVWIEKFGKQGIVLNKDEEEKKVQIQIGTMRVILPFEDITRKITEVEEVPNKEGKVELPTPETLPMKIDLHGKTVDEALVKLDKYLDSASLAGFPFVYIHHGVGTGILRKAIHDFLKTNPHVQRYTTDPENGGVTIVYLK